jgi:hypothetical protein
MSAVGAFVKKQSWVNVIYDHDSWQTFQRFFGNLETLFFGGGASLTPCASPPPWPSIFSDYSFWVHHLVNRDDWHLLANAMASDFSVAWQCLSKRTIVFLLRIKLHSLKSDHICMYLNIWLFLSIYSSGSNKNRPFFAAKIFTRS